ncbi:hypothetical protein IQ07DRAFT_576980 [Pyrenochaeta sp. DS3sAY3a]|nr:hypothetical protein IQ07DRAFT_576980 [Pyrenochaeta sp. DS3sAY3a]
MGSIHTRRADPTCRPPPAPERVVVSELPLPPTAPSDEVGACSATINPRRTGCVGKTIELRNGNFLPDNDHIVASVHFSGAPASPDPASIYEGIQLIIIKTDGTSFPNGDSWKCITCGVSADNKRGSTDILEYPQAFKDGRRVLVGNNIVDGGALLASLECTPNTTHIYPIRWQSSLNQTSEGGSIRELRIHPDDIHLGFSSFTFTGGSIGQFAYFSRLLFNPSPTAGLPLAPRYDLVNVTRLFDPNAKQRLEVVGSELKINNAALSIGELRGFSGRGDEITYVGSNWESSNTDLFAVGITTGAVRRLTQHPGYTDPIDVSQDNKWMVILDTRGTNRTEFISGMRHVPPITDLVSNQATTAIRNNGARRFFQPWLLSQFGDCGNYFGQQINAEGNGSPGSINDPQWNAQADPRWSFDQTKIAYYQALTVPPACGGLNPLPCPVSTAQGGRTYRIMLARLVSRKPTKLQPIIKASDTIPWGVPYIPGAVAPIRPSPPPGNYTLKGASSGFANVTLVGNPSKTGLSRVIMTYQNFSNDGRNFLSGSEDVASRFFSSSLIQVDWYSSLVSRGETLSTKTTGPSGFHILIDLFDTEVNANGTLTTTIDGAIYRQPLNKG